MYHILPVYNEDALLSRVLSTLSRCLRDVRDEHARSGSVAAEWDGGTDMRPIRSARAREMRDAFDRARAEVADATAMTPEYSKKYLESSCSTDPDRRNPDKASAEHRAVLMYNQVASNNYRTAEFMRDELAKRGIDVRDSRFTAQERLDAAEKVAVGCVGMLFESGADAYGTAYAKLHDAITRREEVPITPGVYDADTGTFLSSDAQALYRETIYTVTSFNPRRWFNLHIQSLPRERAYVLDGKAVYVSGSGRQREFEATHPDAYGTDARLGYERTESDRPRRPGATMILY